MADLTETTCPACGAKFAKRPYHRKGWFWALCGRQYRPDNGTWDEMRPYKCLQRENERLKGVVALYKEALQVIADARCDCAERADAAAPYVTYEAPGPCDVCTATGALLEAADLSAEASAKAEGGGSD